MNKEMNEVIKDKNQMRLVWIDTATGKPGKGTFLFNSYEEAEGTISAVRKQFPSYHVWLEDRECNEIKSEGGR